MNLVEPPGRNLPFYSQKYKNLFGQARSSRLLYVCGLQLNYHNNTINKHFSLGKCDFEIVHLHYLTNKEPSAVLWSVVKHAGIGGARKKCRGKHEMQSSVFPDVFLMSVLPLPKCFTTEQSTAEASLFV